MFNNISTLLQEKFKEILTIRSPFNMQYFETMSIDSKNGILITTRPHNQGFSQTYNFLAVIQGTKDWRSKIN